MTKLLILILMIVGLNISSITNAESNVLGVDRNSNNVNISVGIKGDYVEENLNSFYLRIKVNIPGSGLKIDKNIVDNKVKSFYSV